MQVNENKAKNQRNYIFFGLFLYKKTGVNSVSKLLLPEAPLVISPSLAIAIGLNEAIVLQQIHYWIKINENEKINNYQGKTWTYNTYKEWQKQIPFFSERTILRTIQKLEKLKILESSNFNKKKYDRTKWYTINYDVLKVLE